MVLNFEQVHNYYERLIFEEVARRAQTYPVFTADMLADVACVALNRLPAATEMPVLLIWGECDRIIPVAHGHAAHDALPGSRLVVLPDVGHFPHVEAPVEVTEVLREFIETSLRRSALITRC